MRFLLFLLPFVSSVVALGSDKLLIISYDGFRFNYLNSSYTPHLVSLFPSASRSRYVVNVFPTQTFPTHFTISTGLYTEIHGVLASDVYDASKKEELHYGYDLFHYNKEVTPIWILNEMQGGRSGVMMWPGSDFEYGNVNPTHQFIYNESFPYEERVDIVMKWFKDPKAPANLVMLYFEEPDEFSHIYGPESPQVKAQIQRMDNLTKYIIDSLKTNDLEDVNVVFMSDHGMDSATWDRVVNLTAVLGDLKAKMYGTSPVIQIYPEEGSLDAVFKKLDDNSKLVKTYKVYKREDIPEWFHYKGCNRAPPILAVAEPSYAFQDLYVSIEEYVQYFNVSKNGSFGVHGYDPRTTTMHPFFLAYGPRFKKNFTIDDSITVRSIDFFPLFTKILRLDMPQLTPNGTIGNLTGILTSGCMESLPQLMSMTVLWMCMIFPLCVIAVSLMDYVKTQKRRAAALEEESSPRFYANVVLTNTSEKAGLMDWMDQEEPQV